MARSFLAVVFAALVALSAIQVASADCAWCQSLRADYAVKTTSVNYYTNTAFDAAAFATAAATHNYWYNSFWGTLLWTTSSNTYSGLYTQYAHKLNCGGCVGNAPGGATPNCIFCPGNGANGQLITGSCAAGPTCGSGVTIGVACPLDKYQYAKIRGEVYPNKYAYYYVVPPNQYFNFRLVVRTVDEAGNHFDTTALGDNLDVYIKVGSLKSQRFAVRGNPAGTAAAGTSLFIKADTNDLPSYANSNYNYKSVRESNPWAIDIVQSNFGGTDSAAAPATAGGFQCGTANYGSATTSCSPLVIGIMGDNQFPQKSGASQFELYWYYDFEFPDFKCLNAPGTAGSGSTHLTYNCQNLEYAPLAGFTNTAMPQARMFRFPFAPIAAANAIPASLTTLVDDSFTTPVAGGGAWNALTSTPHITSNYAMFLSDASATVQASSGWPVLRLINWKHPGLAETLFGASFTGDANIAPLKTQRNKKGAVYFNEPLSLDQGFEVNFRFRIQNQNPCGDVDGFCGGGDGFAFVAFNPLDAQDPLYYYGTYASTNIQQSVASSRSWYDTTPTATGAVSHVSNAGLDLYGSSSGMGYTNIVRSFAIEFDTWHNPDLYDPKQGVEHWWVNATEYVSYADNHVAFFSHGQHGNSADHSSEALIAATPSIPNLSDRQVHTVKIWYFPRAGIYPGSLSLFIDNMDRPALVADMTLTRPLQDPTGPTCYGHLSWIDTVSVVVGYPGTATAGTVTVSQTGLTVPSAAGGITGGTTQSILRFWPRTFTYNQYDYWRPRTLFVTAEPSVNFWPTASGPAVGTVHQNWKYTATLTLSTGSASTTVSVDVQTTDAPRLLIQESAGFTTTGLSAKMTDTFLMFLSQSPGSGETVSVCVGGASATTHGVKLSPAPTVRDGFQYVSYDSGTAFLTVPTTVAPGTCTTGVYTFDETNWNIPINVTMVTTAAPTVPATGTLQFILISNNNAVYTTAVCGATTPASLSYNIIDPAASFFVTLTMGNSIVSAGSAVAHLFDKAYPRGGYPLGAETGTPSTAGNNAVIRISSFTNQSPTWPALTIVAPSGCSSQPAAAAAVTANEWGITYKDYLITTTCALTGVANNGLPFGVTVTPAGSETVFYVKSDGTFTAAAAAAIPVADLNTLNVNMAEAAVNSQVTAIPTHGKTAVMETSPYMERCTTDFLGRGFIGFTGATGQATQDMDILSWSYCHRLGCVAY